MKEKKKKKKDKEVKKKRSFPRKLPRRPRSERRRRRPRRRIGNPRCDVTDQPTSRRRALNPTPAPFIVCFFFFPPRRRIFISFYALFFCWFRPFFFGKKKKKTNNFSKRINLFFLVFVLPRMRKKNSFRFVFFPTRRHEKLKKKSQRFCFLSFVCCPRVFTEQVVTGAKKKQIKK